MNFTEQDSTLASWTSQFIAWLGTRPFVLRQYNVLDAMYNWIVSEFNKQFEPIVSDPPNVL